MTVLNFLHPLDFFHEVKKSRKKFMALDLGEKSIGICFGEGSAKTYHFVKGKDLNGYVLSPLEEILNQNNDGSGICDEGFISNGLFSPQVLNPRTMTVPQMRDVLNQLASKYNVKYFIFGYNAYKKAWHKKNQYKFIKNLLKDLEDDGRLTKKWFSFVNESGSTKCAKALLKEHFPELNDPQKFFEKYKQVLDDRRYHGPGDKNFIRDLNIVYKRMLDSYSAYCFTEKFFSRDWSNTPMTREEKEIFQKMVDYAKDIDYPISRISRGG